MENGNRPAKQRCRSGDKRPRPREHESYSVSGGAIGRMYLVVAKNLAKAGRRTQARARQRNRSAGGPHYALAGKLARKKEGTKNACGAREAKKGS